MREYISLLQKEGRYSSAKSYQDAMNSFIRYSGTDRIPYTYINKDTLRRYEAYLLEKGCMRNTVSTYIRRLRCIYNKAVENGEAAFIPSLFKGVFTGVESQRKKSLPLGDLNRLMTVPVKGEKLRKTQLALCLMFQYGGMSFVDFAHLNRGNIKNGILDYNRQKTGTSMRLEVLDTAEAMYKELAGERGGGSGYLFPFLSGTKNGHEEYLEYTAALSRFNRNLKTLKEVAGIVSDVQKCPDPDQNRVHSEKSDRQSFDVHFSSSAAFILSAAAASASAAKEAVLPVSTPSFFSGICRTSFSSPLLP